MPGYPDNINRASDGNYWMAWLGMRTPSFDLALRHPGMRKRMTRRLPQDEWLFPNINTGGVVKFNETGGIVEALGDLTGAAHPMVTSMREHKGYLYIGGILNNRIGRYRTAGRRSRTGPAPAPIGASEHDPRSAPRPVPRQGGDHPADGRGVPAQHARSTSAPAVRRGCRARQSAASMAAGPARLSGNARIRRLEDGPEVVAA